MVAPLAREHALGYLIGPGLVVVGYVGSVVMANWASTHWTPVLVGSLIVPAGTVLAGVTLILRDLLHETLGGRGVLVAITLLSILVV